MRRRATLPARDGRYNRSHGARAALLGVGRRLWPPDAVRYGRARARAPWPRVGIRVARVDARGSGAGQGAVQLSPGTRVDGSGQWSAPADGLRRDAHASWISARELPHWTVSGMA